MERKENKPMSVVRNPLTLISVFSGVTIAAANTVLPFINSNNQSIYIWFLMLYPIVLVLVFFATLNFNPKVLYSPSDYKEDKSFLEIMSPKRDIDFVPDPSRNKVETTTRKLTAVLPLSIEQKALQKYEVDKSIKVIKDMNLTLKNKVYIVDGIYINDSEYRIIEVKFLGNDAYSTVRNALLKFRHIYDQLDEKSRINFRTTYIGVIDADYEIKDSEKLMFYMLSLSLPFSVDIVFYKNSDLA